MGLLFSIFSSSLLGFRFSKNKSFSPFFELDFVDPDFRVLFFWKFRIQEFVIFQHKYLFCFKS